MKVFATYANDRFKQSVGRITQQAKDYGMFDHVHAFSPSDVSPDFVRATEPYIQQPRGNGFYLWKPYVLQTLANQYPDGTILVYADAGCTLNRDGKARMQAYFQYLQSYSSIRFQMTFPEHQFSTLRALEYLQAPEDARHSGQYLGGILLFRLCAESRELISKWYDLACSRPDLFSDMYNAESKAIHPEFVDHRHDQSVLSILTKLHMAGVLTIKDETHVCPENHDKPILATRLRY